jgi:resuscitation-promoting factor RpfA
MAMRFVSISQIIFMFCILFAAADMQPAKAQLFFSRIPPADVVSIVRNRGFYDVTFPYFRGDVYVVDASERRGLRVRLIVDPRTGEIVERLIIGRNNRVYPAGPNMEEPLGVERPARNRRMIDPDMGDDERPSPNSNVDVNERRSRIKQIPPKKQRVKRDEPVVSTPVEANPQIIEVRPEKALPDKTPVEQMPATPSNVQIVPPRVDPPKTGDLTKTPIITPPVVSAPPLQAVPPPAKALEPSTTAPGQTQRGTRENPRKIGPIVPPPIGLE